jgi:hypothetical protein
VPPDVGVHRQVEPLHLHPARCPLNLPRARREADGAGAVDTGDCLGEDQLWDLARAAAAGDTPPPWDGHRCPAHSERNCTSCLIDLLDRSSMDATNLTALINAAVEVYTRACHVK